MCIKNGNVNLESYCASTQCCTGGLTQWVDIDNKATLCEQGKCVSRDVLKNDSKEEDLSPNNLVNNYLIFYLTR